MYHPAGKGTQPIRHVIIYPFSAIAVNSESHHAPTKNPNEETEEAIGRIGWSLRRSPGPQSGRAGATPGAVRTRGRPGASALPDSLAAAAVRCGLPADCRAA